jgi:hypothetical protein
MKLEAILKETDARKLQYWEGLKDVKTDQATLLLAFVQDAFREDARRTEHIDQKGNWLLSACFTAVGVMAVFSKSAIDGVQGCGLALLVVLILAVFACLVAAIFSVSWGIRVNATWFQPNPDLVLRKEIFEAEPPEIQIELITHYAQNFSLNAGVSQNKATSVCRGQWFLLVAIGIAVLLGATRMFV